MEQKLANLIKQLAESELQCDTARHALNQHPEFDVKLCFKILDKFHRDVLNPRDISVFLKNNQVSTTDDEVDYFFNSYDKDETGRIGLNNFTDFVTPKNLSLAQEKQEISKSDSLSQLLRVLFEREFDLVRAVNPLRGAVHDLRGYTPIDIFKLLERGRRNTIDYEDVDDFLQRQGVYLTNAELMAFFKRIDKGQYSCISYGDFKKYVLTNASPVRNLANSYNKLVTTDIGTIEPSSLKPYSNGTEKYSLPLNSGSVKPFLPSGYFYDIKDANSTLPSTGYYPTHIYNPFISYRYPSVNRTLASENQENQYFQSYRGFESTTATIPRDFLTNTSNKRIGDLENAKKLDNPLKGISARGFYDFDDLKKNLKDF